MMDNELREFIKEQRAKGMTDKQMEDILVSHGWKVDEVRAAFDILELNVPLPKVQPVGSGSGGSNNGNSSNANSGDGSISAVPPEQGSRSGIWDAFENVIMFITMGFVAISIGLLLNYFVDEILLKSIIDPEISPYLPQGTTFDINSELASGYAAVLVVSLPIFTILFLRISKRTKENPALKNMLVRKVLTYITMIITSIIVIVNLISVVYRLLAGDLGIEDFFDFVIIVGIGSIVFYYFLTQTKEDRKK